MSVVMALATMAGTPGLGAVDVAGFVESGSYHRWVVMSGVGLFVRGSRASGANVVDSRLVTWLSQSGNPVTVGQNWQNSRARW